MSSVTIRCGGGCGSELLTSDPVNRWARYLCPSCLEVEVHGRQEGRNDG